MRNPELTLIQRVLRGDLNFERLVEVMRTDGYLIDTVAPEGCGFGRVAIDSVNQEDFDALFNFFYPGEEFDVEICKLATDKGGSCGAFSYALFNSRKMDYDEMMDLLRRHNERFNAALEY